MPRPNTIISFLMLLSFLLLPTMTGGVGASSARDLGVTEGTQWSPYLQWTLVNPTWSGNAFDVSATVTFTHESSGEIRRSEMFYAGGTSWAFRFTGTRRGRWSFVTSSEDADLHGYTGSVTVVANPRANAHGFLKKIGNKWGWEGTENVFVPQLAMWGYLAGSDDPKVYHNRPDLVDRKIAQFLGEHGFNGFHLAVIGGRWFDFDAASDRVEPTMTDPAPRTFEALELLITKTHAAGGMVHIWPWGDHSRSQTPRSLKGGIGGLVDRRLQRHIAARLGPVPGWSMGYGFDLDEWAKAHHVKAWRDAMHEHMGWSHFLGGRPMGPRHGTDHSSRVEWNTGLDYSSYEHHRPTYDVYLAALQTIPTQPVMSEDRFRVRTGRYPEKDYTEELTRRGLYHSTMAGGVANIWGIHPDLSPGGVFPNKHWIKTYSMFFHDKNRFLADMKPANPLSDDAETRVLLSRDTQSLVLYREDASTIQVDLSAWHGPLPAVAVDARKPYCEIDLGDLPPQAQTLELPGNSDWVVAVGRFQTPAGRTQHPPRDKAQLSFTYTWKAWSSKENTSPYGWISPLRLCADIVE